MFLLRAVIKMFNCVPLKKFALKAPEGNFQYSLVGSPFPLESFKDKCFWTPEMLIRGCCEKKCKSPMHKKNGPPF